ncbi:leucine-rich repeat-containing serine/threonine-protein kinase [Shewanella sp. 1CM18E]|uniref:leucine-rich repeat-containing protein kinase family protein n=1 Tax=Shewanella sp. 1CM18E TaxID=2929169 RepID=UPI0020C0F445|nr:leucine-rich repeat-containing protein kinase family protein [Shewanella sp. 1CM18E]MCK8047045.1 leucine-rich repeat-containing serine/threonine-protein kinase [Shewanella sp. 1CM18E]
MHTIEQLMSGQLQGCKRLQIAAGLTEFPQAIFNLADSLEVLDLSDNNLSELPDNLEQLTHLKILFLTNNNFDSVPLVLARCPKLEMISFKSNKLTSVPELSLPEQTRWLILTDNQIESLPEDMGRLYRLEKLALAGNKLTSLPDSMANCTALGLARLSANAMTSLPNWLFQLPKLSWLAIDGNPIANADSPGIKAITEEATVASVSSEAIELQQVIGQGASGVIYRAQWRTQPTELAGTSIDIAVKVFKGEVTSDGFPENELANCLQAGQHPNLIKVIAQINEADKAALVMELIPNQYQNLGLPPSLETCTRDTFSAETQFELLTILKMVAQLASGLKHLHQNQVSHGDIYAHNTMYNANAEILFGDFGAATNLSLLPPLQREAMESIEVSALGCFIDDLIQNCLVPSEKAQYLADEQAAVFVKLNALTADCMQPNVALRPRFEEIEQLIQQYICQLTTETKCTI